MRDFIRLSIIAAVITLAACTEPTPSNTQDDTRQKHIARAKAEMEKYTNDLIEKSNIIVFGQVQSEGQYIYLHTIEYLKTPLGLSEEEHLSLGDGVEPGRNIPSLNNMALVFFAEDMTVLQIYKSSHGSPTYETWRQRILCAKRMNE